MKRKTFWMVATVLCMTFAACNNDAIEVDPDPTPEDSLSNENRMADFEFKTKLINNSPFCEINEENMDMIAVMGTGYELQWTTNLSGKNYSRLLGDFYDDNDFQNCVLISASHQPGFLFLRRNADDPTIWNYGTNHSEYFENRSFNWYQIWSPRSKNIHNEATHATFLAFFSPTVKRNYNRPETNLSVHALTDNEGGYYRMMLSRKYEQNRISKELYYRSDLLRDLAIAEARVPIPKQIEYLNGKPLPVVELNFTHPLARLELKGIVEDDDAIEVSVGYAAIAGIDLEAWYYPSWAKDKERWDVRNYTWSDYQIWIEMALDNPVLLNSKESKPLQNVGAEPWVFPQTIEKGWTNAAIGDGAGLMLGVWIKNKYDGSYIVGSEDGYGLVYMPLDPITLESENNYVFEVTFGCQYDVNGNPSGYHISYQPQIQEWNKTEKEVNMVKK